uniref:Uncharacterized protein n=2 Tax=Anguilla anguilla TaxID=7936 RepID=A0A0E9U1D9_ANGAN
MLNTDHTPQRASSHCQYLFDVFIYLYHIYF